MGRFRAGMNVWAVPGNHDTDKVETDAELWRELLAIPPYQKTIMGGVPVFFLNSGHAGSMNPAQVQWFLAEAAAISKDQEVLIVAHHPSFYYVVSDAGLKRTVATAFAGHRAPIWLIGGHGHAFGDYLCTDNGTRFVQMEVTAGTTKVWSDGNAAGYALFGLQNGRVACRIFRSLAKETFQVRPKVEQLTPLTVHWPFELVRYPCELFLEGEYDRTNRVVAFAANDVRCQFTATQFITYRVNLQRYGGKVRNFLLLATISQGVLPSMSCGFSTTGPNGPWVNVPFQPDDGFGVSTIPIPASYLTAPALYIKVSTSLERYGAGVTISGWGLGTEAQYLTPYEKWITTRYRTFLKTPKTAPQAKPDGSQFSNIELFAFNLLTTSGNGYGNAQPPSPVTGTPVFSRTPKTLLDFKFARRTSASAPGITYTVEESADLKTWNPVATDRLAISPLSGDWEEVLYRVPILHSGTTFRRVRIDSIPGGEGPFNQWPGRVAVVGGSGNDTNANGIDDLVEFAFDLATGEAPRGYDPARPGKKAGLPVMRSQTVLIPSMTFARMSSQANPGIAYTLERSSNLTGWAPVNPALVIENITESNGDWDKVELAILETGAASAFYRLRLELSETLVS